MSYEALLIAGAPSDGGREARRVLVGNAAAQVPNCVDWTIHETSHATLALVRTSAAGGTFVRADTAAPTKRVIIGVSEPAIDAATRPPEGSGYGAEAGHVAILLAQDGTVEISIDGIGFIPSFWSRSPGEFRFATHLASLVSMGVSAEGSEIGMLEYLTMLHPLGDHTILRDVSLLQPGGRLIVEPGTVPRLSIQRVYLPCAEEWSDEQAIAEFGRVWSRVISDMAERIGDARPALGLSGGLDSRAIAVECVRQDFAPFTFTYGALQTAEGCTAARIAGALDLNHAIIPVPENRFLSNARAAVDLLDGAHSPAEMYELWFTDVLRSFADVLINGLAGGPLWGDDKAVGLTGLEAVLEVQWRRYRPELERLRRYLAPGFAAPAAKRIRTSLRDSMDEWNMSDRTDMVMFWKIHNRQIRWGNSLTGALRRSGLRIEAPFLDSRFLQYSAKLSPAQRKNGRLYLEVQRRHFPETAGIPRDSDGNSPQGLNHVYWSGESSYLHQVAGLARRHPVSAARRLTRQLEAEALDRLPDWGPAMRLRSTSVARRSVFPADLWLRSSRTYRRRLLALLESSPALEIFSPSALERTADDLRDGQPTTGALLIAKIATLQSWFDDFARRRREYRSLMELGLSSQGPSQEPPRVG